ncbi:uncharacterized protein LOC116171618 isoform X2 [Photinus pyralis]|uniref:Uncharacterized protein n=1 Tax=Photinus pyralis TaxID=7054 RepID=A0A1Y1LWE1_PHOPY|nr:uncharacterized protein LOC116171618 isoform X2 [Photinus pyralis]
MENKSIVSNTISADLHQSWHIPRPTLARSSQGSTSSNNSTQSIKSGSLLLTAANLAKVHKHETKHGTNRDSNLQYYLQQVNKDTLSIPMPTKKQDTDTDSNASSMHFTVVNVNTKPQMKSRSFCRKHQLSILIITMSILFTVGVLVAILCLEVRARGRTH